MIRILTLFLLFLLAACGAREDGEATETDGVTIGQHRIFVTSATYDGNLGGLTGADAKCDSVAKAAGLELTYKAILSDSSTNAKARLAITGQVVVVDSNDNVEVIAASTTDFWGAQSADLLMTVNINESGGTITGKTPWTGTSSEGAYALYGCNDWTKASNSSGTIGSIDHTDDRWIDSDFVPCGNSNPLYCISI